MLLRGRHKLVPKDSTLVLSARPSGWSARRRFNDRLPVVEIGPLASRLLPPLAQVRVVASMAGCIYTTLPSARDAPAAWHLQSLPLLLCLGPLSLGRGALNALVVTHRWPGGHDFKPGDVLALDRRRAKVWCPERRLGDEIVDSSTLGAAASLIPQRELGARGVEAAFWRSYGAAFAALERWLDARAASPPEEMLGRIGLGPGLTPAWDDVLIGALLAMHRRRPAHLRALTGALRGNVLARTNAISRAHLCAACQGLGAEVAHRALSALFAPYNSSTTARLNELAAHGGTSGAFSLAGMRAVAAARVRGEAPSGYASGRKRGT